MLVYRQLISGFIPIFPPVVTLVGIVESQENPLRSLETFMLYFGDPVWLESPGSWEDGSEPV